MSELIYGFVGGGFIAGFQLRALRELRGIDVGGFYSKDPVDHLIAYCRDNRLGDAKEFDSVEEMTKAVDVIVVGAPNFTRLETVEKVV
ncbi:MAG: Gfo/Idh/MocA family oxidoreductase, partial [Planctomycetota bacterium]